MIQDKIDRYVLKFPEAPQESMAVDADLFHVVDVNTTSVDFSFLMPNKNLCVRTNKSKVNLLQVFCPQEKQLIQATQGMSNLKINRSVTSNRYNSAKLYGKSTLIQVNNVHIDKGKSVAYPIEEPVFSYKEILGKSHLNLCKIVPIVRMILSVKGVSIYWLNVLLKPKKKTVRGNKNQELVDLNQDLLCTLSRSNQDLGLNMYSKKWLN